MSKPTIAVTGAAGLVGSHLVEHLIAREYPVIAVVRAETNTDCLPKSDKLRIARASVTDAPSLKSAFAGADVVVHAAGSVDPFGSREAIFNTNYGGTQIAFTAATQSGVKQFIHVSSLSVITGQGDQYDVDESAELKPCGESYADSKVEAEKFVMSNADRGGPKVTVVRPGFIYGPRERAWMPRLINSIESGKAALIDGGTKETNVIYVGNLSKAIEGAILNDKAYGRVYNLTDGQKTTKKQLFDAIAEGLGLPKVSKKMPSFIARPFCQLVSSVAPILPPDTQRKLARYSRAAYRLAGVNQGFSIARAEKEIGYTNRIPFEEGMSKTLEWFRQERAGQGNAARSLSEARR